MSKVLLLGNSDIVIYNFRLELIEELIRLNHNVTFICPNGDRVKDLVEIGADHFDISIDRRSINPIKDFRLLRQYKKLFRKIEPDIIFSYTIKPNIYGAIAARKNGIQFVANITGLGSAVERKGLKQKICIILYKYAFKNIKRVFFQNKQNQSFFVKYKIAIGKHFLLPGSGVNLERFKPLPYPDDDIIRFVFLGRIMEEKGIELYLEAAKVIRLEYPNTEFHVCGYIENDYCGKLNEYINDGVVIYHGMVRNVSEIHKKTHCTVFPSFYPEGISNVLLESAACARPIITTDRPGCVETVDDGLTGFIVPTKNKEALIASIKRFLSLSNVKRREMGLLGRKKVENEFDRKIVIRRYLEELV